MIYKQASPLYSKASTPESFISYHQDALLTTLSRPSSAPELRSNSTSTDFFPSHEATATSSNSGILNTQNKMVPSPFSKMMTYQLCTWLCANPTILQLANNMHISMQVPVANGGQFALSPISSNLSNMSQNQEDKTKAYRDYLDKLKSEGIECIKVANKNLGDSCNKLINGIMKLSKLFKEQRSRNTTGPLQKDEIVKFMDESVTIQVLSRWLNAMNMGELKEQHLLPHLRKFVQHALVINYEGRNVEGKKH
ncbi:hypothetical protein RclHR1_04040003 [Rhizophagus clarus]|uniref:Uncharacterized protein n=1 Tax=Rhizophagus clarus TaxID=94130 RepID=A0A2Z6RIU1_9GLOM|nr:hypothetical protein RclHR1_04040003 [Rhizophagus clarus]